MTWNYRIVEVADEVAPYFGLFEVYYDSENVPWGRTEQPILVGDTAEEVIEAIEMALSDAKKYSTLNDSEMTGDFPGDEMTGDFLGDIGPFIPHKDVVREIEHLSD